VFEKEEVKRKAAYDVLIAKLELMVSNRDAAELRSTDKAQKWETTSINKTGEQSASAELHKQHQVTVPHRVRPVSPIATVK